METVLQGDVAVAAQQGAFAEATASVEHDDEALQFVVGGWSCLDRGIEVGISAEEELLPAGEGVVDEVELVLAADEDAAQVIGVVAWPGAVARHWLDTSRACFRMLMRLL
jgi:hypothetical protein